MVPLHRTCTEMPQGEGPEVRNKTSHPIEKFQDVDAYVLLGAPGTGKTTEFKRQAESSGGCYISARDFLTFDEKPEWHNQPLFIDGLDEVRAQSHNALTRFDGIRRQLDRLGCPKFRVSCRITDWFGSNDRLHLQKASPNGEVKGLRLDAFSQENIADFLSQHTPIADADGFLDWATERGINDLLSNPQSLGMLARAFGEGKRPESRQQAFELACQTLIQEHNLEHKIAKPPDASVSVLMDVAGKLCTLQILSGKAGFALPPAEHGQQYLALEQVTQEDHQRARHVLGTKLFDCPDESRCTPVHRQISEFLAARFLAKRISQGLPIRRILALMTGYDGGIVSELRGLCAWLAARSQSGRAELIERDPLGVVLYGDVRTFSVGDKQRILGGIAREAKRNPWIIGSIHLDSRLGDFVTPDVEDLVRSVLTNPERDHAKQSLASIVIEMLGHSAAFLGLSDILLELIRDDSRWPRMRSGALRALIRQHQGDEEALEKLKILLVDIHEGRVVDSDEDLLSELLHALYPAVMSVHEVVQYLKPPSRANYFGAYKDFWMNRVARDSSRAELAEFLTELSALDRQQSETQDSWRWVDHWQGSFQTLLRRFLDEFEGEVDSLPLYDWLEIATRQPHASPNLSDSMTERAQIRTWLTQHPKLQIALFKVGFQRCLASPESEAADFASLVGHVWYHIFQGSPPPEFTHWCLEQVFATTDRRARHYLLEYVARVTNKSPPQNHLSREYVESRLKQNPELLDIFRGTLNQLSIERQELRGIKKNTESEAGRLEQEQKDHDRQRRKEWRDLVKAHEEALAKNTAPPKLLGQIATAYLGGYSNVSGDTPLERLQDLLGDDDELIATVLKGIRGSLRHQDLPSIGEIIRLGTKNRTHYLSWAFWAAIEESRTPALPVETCLSNDQMRLALAIHYNVPVWPRSPDMPDEPPDWFGPLLQSQPELVSDVLIRTARARLRNGADFSTALYALSHSPDHAALARLASLPLLKSFPLRCRKQQLPSLSHLLQAALRHCEKRDLLGLVEQKADQPNMNLAQRVYWLTAALLASPEAYIERLGAFVTGNERRVHHMAELVLGRFERMSMSVPRSNVSARAFLIKHIGRFHAPFTLASDHEENLGAIQAFDIHGIDRLISDLASISTASASRALEELVQDEHLRLWHPRLVDAIYRQNAIRREAEFFHMDVDQITGVLDNRTPANAADLAALTLDNLSEIARDIRDGNTSDWRQFWNVDSHNRAQVPRPEDAGRDFLLSQLNARVKSLGIDAQPEGRYADNKRSDIRVSYNGHNVPVEIKRSCHPDLWSAVRTQLIAKYTKDPGAEGYGLYLVLWFGNTEHCRPTPNEGSPPKSAPELEKLLLDRLSASERLKISICVVDASQPD